ncbi:hypothetical protein PICMEDRAFT_86459 [Pichia membranifaciens NRRL Y-2026]|uniref:Uncharacterized protein n=1 Tax=Pichia membranifaciens NRRL Y-2026 TaxID=763406 RepID=A0A1E3NST6_9ASCO|nr:hypothetical protein PICMEDRAFT_86459 [Pichia membranifaciens NRRL Y-2026]ODQ48738.1 hypothetical protein PICMEDRAFT_86459 [Pichia membranifaciens NRRL Y-2026]
MCSPGSVHPRARHGTAPYQMLRPPPSPQGLRRRRSYMGYPPLGCYAKQAWSTIAGRDAADIRNSETMLHVAAFHCAVHYFFVPLSPPLLQIGFSDRFGQTLLYRLFCWACRAGTPI